MTSNGRSTGKISRNGHTLPLSPCRGGIKPNQSMRLRVSSAKLEEIKRTQFSETSPIVLDGERVEFVAPYASNIYTAQHVGGRKDQEDTLGALRHPYGHLSIYFVADGVGGHHGGDIASAMVKGFLETLARQDDMTFSLPNIYRSAMGGSLSGKLPDLHRQFDTGVRKIITGLMLELIGKIQEKGKDEELRKMSSTVTVGFEIGRRVYIANLGDSRAYLLRDNDAIMLTEDHSMAWLLVRKHSYDLETAKRYMKQLIQVNYPELSEKKIDAIVAREFRSSLHRCLKVDEKLSFEEKEVSIDVLRPTDGLLFTTDGWLKELYEDAFIAPMPNLIVPHFKGPFEGNPAEKAIDSVVKEYPDPFQLPPGVDNMSLVFRAPA